MPTANLFFDNYRFVDIPPELPPFVSPTIVGSDPWDDIWEGNYTETWRTLPSFETGEPERSTAAVADFPATSGIGTLTVVNCSVRVVLTNAGLSASDHFDLELWDAGGTPVARVALDESNSVLSAPTDGLEHAIDFITQPWSLSTNLPITAAELTDLFQAGGSVALARTVIGDSIPGNYGLRVNWVGMAIAWEGVTVAPPCRLYPRDDNLGNTPRLFPPPTTRQRSQRVGGYY